MVARIFAVVLAVVLGSAPVTEAQDTQAATRWLVSTWRELDGRTDPAARDAYTTPLREFVATYDAALLACETGAPEVDTAAAVRDVALAYRIFLKSTEAQPADPEQTVDSGRPANPVGAALLRNHGRSIKLFVAVYDAAILDACLDTDPPLTADWLVTPTSIQNADTGAVNLEPRAPVLSSLWGADRWSSASRNRQPESGFVPGAVVIVAPGRYPKFRLTRTFDVDPAALTALNLNPDGSVRYGLRADDRIPESATVFGRDPMTYLVAEVPGSVVIEPDRTVGSTQNLYVEWSGAVTIEGFVFEGDDLACVQTENMKQAHEWQEKRDIRLVDCRLDGGWNAGEPGEVLKYGKTKWGMLTYGLGASALGADVYGFQWTGSGLYAWDAEGVWEEHIAYHHSIRGLTPEHAAVLVDNIRARWSGRTFFQSVARLDEIADWISPKQGQGKILIRNCYVEDVCLQDGGGGSALTFAGNHDGDVRIEGTTVKLGCNPKLASRTDNITGALVVYAGGGSGGFPTRSVTLDGCHFEVGSVFPGKGAARRPNVQVSDVTTFRMVETAVWNWVGTREALEIDTKNVGKVILDDENDIRGDCIFDGQIFRDVDADGDKLPDGEAYRALLKALADHPKVEIVDAGAWGVLAAA